MPACVEKPGSKVNLTFRHVSYASIVGVPGRVGVKTFVENKFLRLVQEPCGTRYRLAAHALCTPPGNPGGVDRGRTRVRKSFRRHAPAGRQTGHSQLEGFPLNPLNTRFIQIQRVACV